MKQIILLVLIIIVISSCQNKSVATNSEIQTTSDGVKYLIHPSKINSGGPPKDGIPSIDNPKFVAVTVADEWIQDNELVLAIIHKNVTKVYPMQIMVWHEIVNDNIADDPILITYCPLCGTGIAYERKINDQEVEFGTSGKLYNSNLVMYDRLTESYWTQIEGKAIVGELTGMKLKPVSINTVLWSEWKINHPNSLVISQDTGFDRNYGKDPYGSYYQDSFIMFPTENQDNRIHPKTVIFGIEINETFKAYKEVDLIKNSVIKDTVANQKIIIQRDVSGVVTFTNLETNQEIVKERGFWFSWYAFHPNTLLFIP